MVDNLALIDIAIVQPFNCGGSPRIQGTQTEIQKLGTCRKSLMISISYPRFSTVGAHQPHALR